MQGDWDEQELNYLRRTREDDVQERQRLQKILHREDPPVSEYKPRDLKLTTEIVKEMVTESKDEIETTSTGGKQAKEPYDYSLLPKEALHLITLNMTAGAEKYGKMNYLDIPVEINAGRAVAHLQMACMTDEERQKYSSEDRLRHLINGATRALFALDCELRGKKEV